MQSLYVALLGHVEILPSTGFTGLFGDAFASEGLPGARARGAEPGLGPTGGATALFAAAFGSAALPEHITGRDSMT